MGPIRFLTLRRMHLAHRALLRADQSKATVTQIVTNHGFWELGRFSVAYRALFGESPSETLRRSAEQTAVGSIVCYPLQSSNFGAPRYRSRDLVKVLKGRPSFRARPVVQRQFPLGSEGA